MELKDRVQERVRLLVVAIEDMQVLAEFFRPCKTAYNDEKVGKDEKEYWNTQASECLEALHEEGMALSEFLDDEIKENEYVKVLYVVRRVLYNKCKLDYVMDRFSDLKLGEDVESRKRLSYMWYQVTRLLTTALADLPIKEMIGKRRR